jgi:hypothetical protein
VKTKDFAKIGKGLLELLPAYSVKGSLVYSITTHNVLRGVSFEGSSFDRSSFYIWFFVMPLSLPTDTLYFNLGERLRDRQGGDRWDINQPDVLSEIKLQFENQAVPWLATFESAITAIDAVKKMSDIAPNVRSLEASAVLLASYGDTEGTQLLINRCLSMVDSLIAWQREVAEQLGKLSKACMESNQAVEGLLGSWSEKSSLIKKLFR